MLQLTDTVTSISIQASVIHHRDRYETSAIRITATATDGTQRNITFRITPQTMISVDSIIQHLHNTGP